ncbi:hypothetical protein OPT61_g9057 [Boeremia exigua]|uniref:Uncharacterized protein n=1 Tax=Boeremia exigua TaxID=749465 RepID=A0ACC2HW93_9PLEO|nr:hypothetical protein OPT61_g9057 [Boeremia exigua]
MTSPKITLRLRVKTNDYGEIVIASEPGKKSSFTATAWFLPPKEFSDLVVDLSSSQVGIDFYEGDMIKVTGCLVAFDKPSAKDPMIIRVSYFKGEPSIDNLIAMAVTTRAKVEGPLDRCPSWQGLGWALWK